MRHALREEEGSIKRVGMLVVHSNPLADPGSGDAGGMTVYVREVARALARRGIEVDLYTRRDSPSSSDEIQLSPGVRVIQIRAGDPGLTKEEIPTYLSEFTENLLDRVDWEGACYELIHSHYWLSGRVASVLARHLGVGFVHTFHTLGRVKNSHAPGIDVEEPLDRLNGEEMVIAEADAIVASTEEERGWLMELYGAHPERIYVVPPGVDHELFRRGDKASARRRLGLGSEKVLLFVGRLQPLKAADTAIHAFAELVKRLDLSPDGATLLVVGGPSGRAGAREPERLRGIASQAGVAASVRFVSAMPQNDLPDFYRAADAIIVPSRAESFGLVALEAQACGLPVVASRVGGLKEIVREGETGFLVDPEDVSAFADRCERLLSDSMLAEAMGLKGETFSSDFSWQRCASQLQDLYSLNSRACYEDEVLAS